MPRGAWRGWQIICDGSALSAFHHVLRLPTVMMGFALPDDRMHAPNEKFHLLNFHKGIAASIFFFDELGAKREANATR
jgi:hypothetical protein